MPDASVIVAHPGTQHSYEAALALQDAGLLREYITGLYFKEDGWPGRLERLLPSGTRQRFAAQLTKRRRLGLPGDIVRTHPWLEGAFVLSKRQAMPRWLSDHTYLIRNRVFYHLVARRVEASSPRALLCYDDCGVRVLQAAARVGSFKVLDQTCPHLTTSTEIVRRENSAVPADLRVKLPAKWRLDQSIQEVRLADLILAGSAFVKDSIVRIGVPADNVVVLPYGANLELFYPASEKRPHAKVTAMFAGQLAARKGINYLLEAFRDPSILDCRLLLVGGGSSDKTTLEKYGVPFEHVPFAPRTELAKRYREADFFVYPSLLEGSALVTYEALASGLPVITTPNSGSVVRDGIEGLIVPPRDVHALRDSIQKLAVNPDLRHAMGLAARRRAEEYSWGKYHQRLAAIIGDRLALRAPVTGLTESGSTFFAARAQ